MGEGEAVCGRMQIRMQNADVLTQEQIHEFLKGSRSIEFTGQNRAELYGFVQQVLVAQQYARQGKKQRGAVRAYRSKVTGLSLPQRTRLIRCGYTPRVIDSSPHPPIKSDLRPGDKVI
jgi:hypothetical protein